MWVVRNKGTVLKAIFLIMGLVCCKYDNYIPQSNPISLLIIIRQNPTTPRFRLYYIKSQVAITTKSDFGLE